MERDYLADSQDDLFENSQVGPLPILPDSPQAQAVPESPAPPTVAIPPQDKIMAMLSEILKEQKRLKEEVTKLRGEVQRIKSQETPSLTKVSVEGSAIEKEYVNILKAKFSTFPWINFQNQEIQENTVFP